MSLAEYSLREVFGMDYSLQRFKVRVFPYMFKKSNDGEHLVKGCEGESWK